MYWILLFLTEEFTNDEYSYVLASYARFLWDADEEDDEEHEAVLNLNVAAAPSFFQEASQQFPIAAAS